MFGLFGKSKKQKIFELYLNSLERFNYMIKGCNEHPRDVSIEFMRLTLTERAFMNKIIIDMTDEEWKEIDKHRIATFEYYDYRHNWIFKNKAKPLAIEFEERLAKYLKLNRFIDESVKKVKDEFTAKIEEIIFLDNCSLYDNSLKSITKEINNKFNTTYLQKNDKFRLFALKDLEYRTLIEITKRVKDNIMTDQILNIIEKDSAPSIQTSEIRIGVIEAVIYKICFEYSTSWVNKADDEELFNINTYIADVPHYVYLEDDGTINLDKSLSNELDKIKKQITRL